MLQPTHFAPFPVQILQAKTRAREGNQKPSFEYTDPQLPIQSAAIGTAKLRVVVEDRMENSGTTVERLLNTFLSVDLDFPDRFKALANLLKEHNRNKFVVELVFFKIVKLYLFVRLNQRDEEKVRGLLGESLNSRMAGVSNEERNRRKSRVLAGFEKAKLIKY